jgi:hypothetical protein
MLLPAILPMSQALAIIHIYKYCVSVGGGISVMRK